MKEGGQADAALEPLREAHRRFVALGAAGEQMVSACLTDLGDCLMALGRLDDAAASYQAGIEIAEKLEHHRGMAVGKLQIGTVRLHQGRYKDALEAYAQARQAFEALGDPATVASVWYQTGVVYRLAGDHDQAEQAYRRSLAIDVKLGNRAGEADSLLELANLYDAMGRWEDAVTNYRQAADRYVELQDRRSEGLAHSNLANTLIKIDRLPEARDEIRRAIACKRPFGHVAQPWKTWGILQKLEQAAGNPGPAAAARSEAIAAYAAYRRDGGENQSGSATPQLCDQVAQAIAAATSGATDDGDPLQQITRALAADADLPTYLQALLPKLQAILQGDRDADGDHGAGLADDPALDYDDAAEIRLLLERLG